MRFLSSFSQVNFANKLNPLVRSSPDTYRVHEAMSKDTYRVHEAIRNLLDDVTSEPSRVMEELLNGPIG